MLTLLIAARLYNPVALVKVPNWAAESGADILWNIPVKKLREGLEKIAKSVADGRRNTDPTSIARRVSKLFGKRQAAAYFRYEVVPLNQAERDKLPPPQRGCKRPMHRFECTYDEQAAQRDADYDGYAVLITTASRTQSADVLFTKYKQRCYSFPLSHAD